MLKELNPQKKQYLLLMKKKNFIEHGVFDEKYKDKTKYDLVFVAMIIEHVVDSANF